MKEAQLREIIAQTNDLLKMDERIEASVEVHTSQLLEIANLAVRVLRYEQVLEKFKDLGEEADPNEESECVRCGDGMILPDEAEADIRHACDDCAHNALLDLMRIKRKD